MKNTHLNNTESNLISSIARLTGIPEPKLNALNIEHGTQWIFQNPLAIEGLTRTQTERFKY